MWSRLRIDIGWRDLAAGVLACATASRRDRWEARCERQWSDSDNALICTSVRSGFDLLLQALRLPPDSEVVFSAVTIPDMVRIAREHGLRAVPADLGDTSWTPHLGSLDRAVGPATRLIVIAHLFGTRVDLSPVIQLARKHGNILVVEDCAQAFAAGEYRGHPEADISLFSFGPIKTATALGGGVVRVRDAKLLARMRTVLGGYLVQSRRAYSKRLVKYAGLKVVSYRYVLGFLSRCATRLGRDLDAALAGSARNYADRGLLDQLRRKPNAPLLALLLRRWRNYDSRRLRARTEKGRDLAERIDVRESSLDPESLPIEADTYWLCPVLTTDADLVPELRRAAFDATRQCRLVVVDPPPERADMEPVRARAMMARMTIVPCYAELPDRELVRLAELLRGRVRLPARLPTGNVDSTRESGEARSS